MKKIKGMGTLRFFLFFLFLYYFIEVPFSLYLTISSPSDFGQGTYFNLTYNTSTNTITFDRVTKTGYYVSKIFSFSSKVNITNITWNGYPHGKELPDNRSSEYGYAFGNFNMSDNIALLHLNEPLSSTNFLDSAVGAYRFSCTNCPGRYTGVFGDALSFDDGNNDWVYGNVGPLNPPYTISAWVYFSHPVQPNNNYDYILSINTGGDHFNNIITMSRYALTNQFYTVTQNNVYQSSPLPFGRWLNVVYIMDSSYPYIKVYVNGVQLPLNSPPSPTSVGGDVYLGAWSNPSYVHELFGYLDEVAIWNRSLTQAEIEALYKRGASRVKFQVRACDDPLCNGEVFIGPDGTPNTFYEDNDGNSLSPKVIPLNLNSTAQYFQFIMYYETLNNDTTPEINEVQIGYFSPVYYDVIIFFPQNYSIINPNSDLQALIIGNLTGNIVEVYLDGSLLLNTTVANNTLLTYNLGNLSSTLHTLSVVLVNGGINKTVVFGVSQIKERLEVISGAVIPNVTEVLVEKEIEVPLITPETLITKYLEEIENEDEITRWVVKYLYDKYKKEAERLAINTLLFVLSLFIWVTPIKTINIRSR